MISRRTSFGIRSESSPKTDRLNQVPSWEFRNRRKSFTPRQLARILWDFAYLCWANTLVETMGGSKVTFSFDYDNRPTFHARSIQTDTGWKISLDRGLDLFQRYDMNALSLAAADQTERLTKGCEITYLLEEAEK